MTTSSELTATYRLQLTPSFGFDAARQLVPYLRDLGISHLYLSPSLQARPESEHGYDVIDSTRVSETLGGEAAFVRLAEAGLPLILDIVPNHMAADDRNPSWHNPKLRTRVFDIDPADGRHRRFFTVDGLAGVRQEDPAVFEAAHSKIVDLVARGLVVGLRVDHIDGLADPVGYLQRLSRVAPVPIWVEKILHPGEDLRPDWPVAGTTGYEFLADVDALCNRADAEPELTDLYRGLTGEDRPFPSIAHDARHEQASGPFGPEVARLGREHPKPAFQPDDLVAALIALPVYRTYLRPGEPVDEHDRQLLEAAQLPATPRDLLLNNLARDADFIRRFQQTTPGIMAKGIEDTAFYRYSRLLALNEVGNDPSRFSIGAATFHDANLRRLQDHPNSLLASSTHDTKRSADLRARLLAISWSLDEFTRVAKRWFITTADDQIGGDASWFVLQTMLTASGVGRDRLQAYFVKAFREAAVETTWDDPDPEWEQRVHDLVDRALTDPALRHLMEPLTLRLAIRGRHISHLQALLRATCPGIPDTYQGDEIVSIGLVDPDNRRPVDWNSRRAALEWLRTARPNPAHGDSKLAILHAALQERRRTPESFRGPYEPLDSSTEVVAFLRGSDLAVIAPLSSKANNHVDLPSGTWHDLLDNGRTRTGGRHRAVDELTGSLRIALLTR